MRGSALCFARESGPGYGFAIFPLYAICGIIGACSDHYPATIRTRPMKPAHYRLPPGWLTVTANGIPVQYFGPSSRELAERYATDPECRQSRVIRKVHEDAGRQ